MMKILIESTDRTSLLKKNSLNLVLRSDQRKTCSLELTTTAASFLPQVGQDLQVTDTIVGEAVGTGDGVEDTFYLRLIPILAASYTIYVDEVEQTETTDYTLDTATGELVFVSPPADTKPITADYTSVLFGGIIKTAPRTQLGISGKVAIRITSDGYSSLPARRTIITDWYDILAGDIVEYVVDNFLYEEGVTKGNIQPGETVTRYKRRVVSIKDLLDDMANLCGFKWWIDDNKALNFDQESPISAAFYELREGEDFKDFTELRLEEQFDLYRNKQFIRGGTLDDSSVYVYYDEDTTEIAARAAIEGGSGVHGNVYEDNNILDDDIAAVVVGNLLKKYGQVPMVLTFVSSSTKWRPDTQLTVNLPTYGLDTDSYFLIEQVTITDRGPNNYRVEVTANRRKASTDFSTQRSEDFVDYFSEVMAKLKGASGLADATGRSPFTIIVGTAWSSGYAATKADILAPTANATPAIQQAIDACPEVPVAGHTTKVASATSTTITLISTLTSGYEALSGLVDAYNGCRLLVTGGTGAGLSRIIKTWNRDGDFKAVLNGTSWGGDTPDSTSSVVIYRASGTVMLLDGVYQLLSPIHLRAGVHLIGQGPGTLITTEPSFTGTELVHINPTAYAGSSFVRVANLAIHGGASGAKLLYGYFASHALIENVLFSESNTDDGIIGVELEYGLNSQFVNCEFSTNPAGYGLVFLYGGRHAARNCFFSSNEIGVHIWGSSMNRITGCHFLQNRKNGVYVELSADDNVLDGNFFEDNGMDSTPDAQIRVDDGPDRTVIINNTGRITAAGPTNGYGIYIDGTGTAPSRTLISNNDFYQGGYDWAIRDDGTDTSFGAGNRVKDGTWITTEDYTP